MFDKVEIAVANQIAVALITLFSQQLRNQDRVWLHKRVLVHGARRPQSIAREEVACTLSAGARFVVQASVCVALFRSHLHGSLALRLSRASLL